MPLTWAVATTSVRIAAPTSNGALVAYRTGGAPGPASQLAVAVVAPPWSASMYASADPTLLVDDARPVAMCPPVDGALTLLAEPWDGAAGHLLRLDEKGALVGDRIATATDLACGAEPLLMRHDGLALLAARRALHAQGPDAFVARRAARVDALSLDDDGRFLFFLESDRGGAARILYGEATIEGADAGPFDAGAPLARSNGGGALVPDSTAPTSIDDAPSTGSAEPPRVAAAAGAGVVVAAWQAGAPGDGAEVRAALLGVDGAPLGRRSRWTSSTPGPPTS